jgi:hypothetical protein
MGFGVSKSRSDKADTTKIIENQPFLRQGASHFSRFSSLGSSAGKRAVIDPGSSAALIAALAKKAKNSLCVLPTLPGGSRAVVSSYRTLTPGC